MSIARPLCLLLAVLVLAGCRMRVEVGVTVGEDGAGVLEVAVALDPGAVAEVGDVGDQVRVDDLRATGWTVASPAVEDDGWTWLRARHPFGSPEELTGLVAEISGDDGPFRDFRLRREDAFAESRYEFSGVVDFSDGVAAFSDDEAAEVLDGEPFGVALEELEAELGAVVDELVGIQVAVRLPGEVTSNATTQAANGAVWQPSVSAEGPVSLVATGVVERTERIVWVVVAGVAGVALLLFLVVRLAIWRRGR